jgi:hypothetical protein
VRGRQADVKFSGFGNVRIRFFFYDLYPWGLKQKDACFDFCHAMGTLGIFFWNTAEVFVRDAVKSAHDWRAVATGGSSLDEVGFVDDLTRLQSIFQMAQQEFRDSIFRGHVVTLHELEDARVAIPAVSNVSPRNFSTTSGHEKNA